MTTFQEYFFVNPYPYKKVDDGRVKEDSLFLQGLLGKSQDQILEASKAYRGNTVGLRNFLFVTRSYENLRQRELSSEATTLAVAIMVFAIEGVMGFIRKRWRRSEVSFNERRLIEYLRQCLNKEEKLILLNSFVFSAQARKSVPMTSGTKRHVMYRGMLINSPDDEFQSSRTDWCSAQESVDNIHCDCIGWLSNKDDEVINHYLRKLAKHIYTMRCSIVHDGMAPLISHTEKKPDSVAVWGMTVSDLYFNNYRSRHYQYESAISRMMLEEIFINSLWEAFCKGYPKKI